MFSKLKAFLFEHKNTLIDLAIIALTGLLAITWFRGNFFIKFDDSFFSLNPRDDLYRGTFVWEHVFSTGLPYPKTALIPYWLFTNLFELIGLSLIGSQKLLYYSLFTLSGLSMYYLSRTVLRNNENARVASVASGLFYMMNPFSLTIVWGRQILIVFTYPVLPLILALFINGLNREKSFRYAASICLVSALFAPAFANVYVAVILVMLFLYLVLFILMNWRKRVIRKSLRFVIPLTLVVLMSNLWWILPYIPALKPQFDASMTYSPPVETFMAASSRSSVLNSMRLLGWHFIDTYYYADPTFLWQATFSTVPFILIGFLVPILAYASLLWMKKNRDLIFFALLSVVALFIVKGYNPPFEGVNLWIIMHVPFASAFRISYDKFGIVLVLSYAFLLGFSISKLYTNMAQRIKRLVAQKTEKHGHTSPILRKIFGSAPAFLLILLLILLEGVYAYPYWNGDIIHTGGSVMPSARIQIPSYYYDAAAWINSQNEEFRILKLPPSLGGASVYDWDYGYACSDPLDEYFFVGHPLLGQKWGQPLADRLEDQLSNFVISPPLNYSKFSQLLGLFNVKYAVIHSDWKEGIYSNVPAPQYFETTIGQEGGLELAHKFGKLEFYVTNDYAPLIYSSENAAYVKGSFSLGSLYYLMDAKAYSINTKPIFIFSEDNKGKDALNITKNILISVPIDSIGSSTRIMDVPVDGEYSAYLNADFLSQGEKIQVVIDNETYEATFDNVDTSKPMSAGIVKLNTGPHNLTIEVPSATMYFSDSFAEYNNHAWQPLSGEWVRQNGILKQLSNLDNVWNIVSDLNLTSFILDFDLRPEEPNVNGNGMIFGYSNGNAYAVQLSEQLDAAELWYWNGSYWTELMSSPVEIQTQHWYHVTVEVEDRSATVSIDGTKILEYIDGDPSRNTGGLVGLDGGFKASFDNFTIRDLSENILFRDSFDLPYTWKPFLGNWNLVDGGITSGNVDDSYLMLESNLTDFMVEAKMMIRQQAEDSVAYPGIVFRAKDPYNCYGLFIRRSSNGGMTAIQLWKSVNGSWKYITGQDLPEVNLNRTYSLKLIVSAWRVKVFLDDRQVIPVTGWQDLTGHELPSGSIGLRSRYTDTSFDNITLTAVPPMVNEAFFSVGQSPSIPSAPSLTFHKVDPTKYVADIENATEPFFLSFLESYDDDWKASVNGSYQIRDDQHFVANGFGNAWYINETGKLTITIEYAPQRLFFYGSLISLTTLIACVTYLAYSYTKTDRTLTKIKQTLTRFFKTRKKTPPQTNDTKPQNP